MEIIASEPAAVANAIRPAAPGPFGVRRRSRSQPAASPTIHTAVKPAATVGACVMKAGASEEIGQEGDQ